MSSDLKTPPVVDGVAANQASRSGSSDANWTATLSYFLLTVLGFSFWFFVAVPFASHRESYVWLAMVKSQTFVEGLALTPTTFRPLAQAATWLGFMILNPSVFPTNEFRQTLLQLSIYASFVFAWWLIYRAAGQRRLFALVSLAAGGVFFSGYVQLFHIYGVFYTAVMLTLGAVIHFNAFGAPGKREEVWFAAAATVLAFWHPFATAIFVGFYFGYYLDTFRQRSRGQHLQSLAILLVCSSTIVALVAPSSRTLSLPLDSRIFGFLVTYQTNEINLAASFVAFLLAVLVVLSTDLSPRLKLVALPVVSALGLVFVWKGLPVLFIWLFVALLKLCYLRSWSLFFLAITSILLPFGGGIGTPIYGLFAIIVAVYVTPLGWSKAEDAVSVLKPRYAMSGIAAIALLVILMRMNVEVPIITKAASSLLAERERTYQLEHMLEWLRTSEYCSYDIAFAEGAGSPIDSVESAITRRNRPPAGLGDVQMFWKTALRCSSAERPNRIPGNALLTFGRPPSGGNLKKVFDLEGRYGGEGAVWIDDPLR